MFEGFDIIVLALLQFHGNYNKYFAKCNIVRRNESTSFQEKGKSGPCSPVIYMLGCCECGRLAKMATQ